MRLCEECPDLTYLGLSAYLQDGPNHDGYIPRLRINGYYQQLRWLVIGRAIRVCRSCPAYVFG